MAGSVLLRSTRVPLAGGASLLALLLTSTVQAAPSPATSLVSACSGVRLQGAAISNVLAPLVNNAVVPIQTDVNALLGVTRLLPGGGGLPQPLSFDGVGYLNNIVNGGDINLAVIKSDGTLFGPADTCNTTTDSLQLNTQAGISLGGNMVTGLGGGTVAAAGEINSIALGNGAATAASATGAVAIGTAATVTAASTNAVAIGNGATATTANGVALGGGAVDRAAVASPTATINGTAAAGGAPIGVVSVGTAGGERQIVNVAAGQLSATSTDAVNGSQLFATNTQVNTNTTNIAGNATAITNLNNGTAGTVQQSGTPGRVVIVAPGGTGAAPGAPQVLGNVAPGSLAAGSTDAVNGDQLATTNGNVTANTNAINGLSTGIANGTVGLVQQTGGSPGGGQITVGVATGGTSLNVAGTDGNRTVTGVAAGALTPTSTDAVNGSQLAATNAQVATNTTNIAGNTTAITNLSSSINNGTVGLVQQATPTGPVTVAAANGGTVVDLTGTAGTRTLTGVSAGAAPTDAVNFGQLTTTNAAVTANTTAITNLNNGTAGLVQQTGGSPGAGAITVGAATGGTSLNVAGTGGNRTISGVAAGVAPTDAANVGQLGAATANAVQYDTTGGVRANSVTLAGGAAGPVTVTNVAPGALTGTSTDAVNGSQLAATNGNVAANTTAIANLNTGTTGVVQQTGTPNRVALVAPGATGAAPGAAQTLGNLAAGTAATDAVNLGQTTGLIAASAATAPIQYSAAAAPTTPTPGVVSNDTTLVGMAAGTPVALHNVAAGTVTPTSTDAVNGSQLAATNATVAANVGLIAGNTTAINNLNNGTAGLVQQTGGAPGTGQLTVGAATGGTSVSIAGTDGNRTLTGLANGVAGNDAATVAQINGLTGNGLNNVQYDPSANGGRSNTITLAGGTPGTVRITNVGPGALTAASTDAVNGGQLAATNAGLAALTGGTAGAFQSNNAAAAAAPVASGANASAGGFGATATGAGSVALGNGATSTGPQSVAIGQGSTDGGATRVVSVGGVGSERRITNVAPALNGTDAVNLSQLQTATNSFTTTTAGLQNQLNQTNFDLGQVRRRANGGTAGAMAVAGLPQAFEPGKSMIGGAVGYWADQVAFAIGVSTIVGDHAVVKAGGSISNQGVGGFNAGVGFQF